MRARHALPRLIFLLPFSLLLVTQLVAGSDTPLKPGEVSTGTTIVAVRYRDGVVVAADTRTSVSGYVSNRYATKVSFVLDRGGRPAGQEEGLFPPTEEEGSRVGGRTTASTARVDGPRGVRSYLGTDSSTCCVCRSGSAADTQHLADLCRGRLLRRSISGGRSNTVGDAARLLRALVRSYPDVSASLICAGYDHSLGRGVIHTIAPGGTLAEEEGGWAASGSGSGFIMGYADAEYPQGGPEELSEEGAVRLASRLVGLAMERDGSSGGMIRLYIIDQWGKRAIVRLPSSAKLGGGIVKGKAVATVQLEGFAPPKRS
mmetsp:Transcript_19993/g.40508  ORF Transcript_19993/g.40508 Transcript_19993/m.40508 type:complete len:316 (-) Transcript_19993:124-1071(-)